MKFPIVKTSADEFIPLIIFALFIAARLAELFIKNRKNGKPLPKSKPESPLRPARGTPVTLEEFFKELMAPPEPPSVPEPAPVKWSDDSEEEKPLIQSPEMLEKKAVLKSIPVREQPPTSKDWKVEFQDEKKKAKISRPLETVSQTTALLPGLHGLMMPVGNPLRLPSQFAGKPAFNLKDPDTLRKAMLSHIILSPPRSCDSFSNDSILH